MIKEDGMMAQGNKTVGVAKGSLRSYGTLAIDLSGIDQSQSLTELIQACKDYGQHLDAQDFSYIFGQSTEN